jgi:hypothetical protein
VFNDVDALHALNDIGADGEIHLATNDTEIFASQNLTANALPRALRLADNVDPGAVGSFSFGFNYSTRFSMNPTVPTAWASMPYLITATQPGIAP